MVRRRAFATTFWVLTGYLAILYAVAAFVSLPVLAALHGGLVFAVLGGHRSLLVLRPRRGMSSHVLRNRMKVYRAERDWTQAELATMLGVSRKPSTPSTVGSSFRRRCSL